MLKSINFDKTIYISVIIFALTLPLSRALASLFVILLPILWLLSGDLKEKIIQIKSNKLLVSIALFIIYASITILWSEDTKNYFSALRMFTYLFSIFVIATSIKPEQINTIVSAFLVGMFISEIIAYGVFFELWTFKYATPQNPSPFMIHIDYSVFLAFASIILLNRIFSKEYSIKEKIFFSFFFLTVTGNLFLSTGRTGQVALIFGLITLSFLHFRFSIKSVLTSLILVGVIFSSAYYSSKSFQHRVSTTISSLKVISNLNLNNSIGIRVGFWIMTYDSFKENLFGSGIGKYKSATKKQINKNEYYYLNKEALEFMSDSHPHNQYLLVILQMGIVGIVLFLNILYQLVTLKNTTTQIKQLSILFSVIYFSSCLAEPLLIKQYPLVLFVLFVGLFGVIGKEKELTT